MSAFQAGDVIERREVLHGEVWLTCPVTVVNDDDKVLAVRVDPGAPFKFPKHPFGPHPWEPHPAWEGSIVLQLYRPGDLYSVWKILETDGTLRHWYVNFEAQVVRGTKHIDTDDYGLDLIIEPDGRLVWKDVTDLHHQQVEGRITADTALRVLAAAAQLEEEIELGHLWWRDWSDWSPAD